MERRGWAHLPDDRQADGEADDGGDGTAHREGAERGRPDMRERSQRQDKGGGGAKRPLSHQL
ncbi:hypothetical protein NXV45_12085 [Phocaeicola vulgatus]|nr:hypothetical protein [Phocaeicola vulgatus]